LLIKVATGSVCDTVSKDAFVDQGSIILRMRLLIKVASGSGMVRVIHMLPVHPGCGF
jgi:hypothetical protein